MRTIEAFDRQSLYLITGSRYTLHLHAAFSSDEEYLRLRVFCLYSVGNGNGRKDVSTGSSATYYDSQFIVHFYGRFLFNGKDNNIFAFIVILQVF